MYHRWIVAPHERGLSLHLFLKQRFSGLLSLKKLKMALEQGFCEVNGVVERFASRKLSHQDEVIFHDYLLKQSPPVDFNKQALLYEDEWFLVYNKPAKLTVEGGLDTLLTKYDPSLLPAHRLDRDTTGVILFAKGKINCDKLMHLFRKRLIQKEYLAIVDGLPRASDGVIENYLGKKSHIKGQVIWGEQPKETGLFAKTSWTCLKRGKEASLLSCQPETGRTHQIRIHLAGIGHPILGDIHYAKHFNSHFHPNRVLLHAKSLHFLHPITNRALSLEAALPSDFEDALNRLIYIGET